MPAPSPAAPAPSGRREAAQSPTTLSAHPAPAGLRQRGHVLLRLAGRPRPARAATHPGDRSPACPPHPFRLGCLLSPWALPYPCPFCPVPPRCHTSLPTAVCPSQQVPPAASPALDVDTGRPHAPSLPALPLRALGPPWPLSQAGLPEHPGCPPRHTPLQALFVTRLGARGSTCLILNSGVSSEEGWRMINTVVGC